MGKQVEGKVQETYGKAKDAVGDAEESFRKRQSDVQPNRDEEIGNTDIGRCKFFTITIITSQPTDRCCIAFFFKNIFCKFRDRTKGIIIHFTPGNIRNEFIQQTDHLPGHSCFCLSAQTEK